MTDGKLSRRLYNVGKRIEIMHAGGFVRATIVAHLERTADGVPRYEACLNDTNQTIGVVETDIYPHGHGERVK